MNTDVGLQVQFHSLPQNAITTFCLYIQQPSNFKFLTHKMVTRTLTLLLSLQPDMAAAAAALATFIEEEEEEQELYPISYEHHPNPRENAAHSICT